jgi:hypothetical protein
MTTQLNIENLKKLREFWSKSEPELLDMGDFAHNPDEARYADQQHPCGSSMCAIGSGPSAGIPFDNDMGWMHYSKRVFGVGAANYGPDPEWNFLFSDIWPSSVDQLIARLTLAIDGKIPKVWTYEDQY